MPIVRVELWSGAPAQVKQGLVRGITDVVVAQVKCAPQAVMVLIDERPKEDWSTAGTLHTELFKGVEPGK